MKVQLQLAQALGAELRVNEKVIAYESGPTGVSVTTDHGRYEADKVILTAGAWIGSLLPKQVGKPFGVYRQLFFWFEPTGYGTHLTWNASPG